MTLISDLVSRARVNLHDTKALAEVSTATFQSKASSTNGDYIVIPAQDGTAFAAAVDPTGAGSAPTGAAWTALSSGRKVKVDISACSTAATVATAVKAALNALTGFTAKITASDAAADGTLVFTQVNAGVVLHLAGHNANDSGAGGITTAVGTTGTAYRHSHANMAQFASDAVQLLVQRRPDLFVGQFGSLPDALVIGSTFPLSIRLENPVVDYITARCEALNNEVDLEQRAVAFFALFKGGAGA